MKIVYLLIEEAFRELDARLLQTAYLVKGGAEVLICQQWWFMANARNLPPGIVVFKGNNQVQAHNMSLARQFGHLIASIEEEAFGLLDYGGQELFDPKAADNCDLFLAQGPGQHSHLQKRFPDLKGHVAVVGNSRTDILREPFRNTHLAKRNDIGKRHGRFILINTNFASINSAYTDTYEYFTTCVDLGIIDGRKAEDMDSFHSWCRWEKENLTALLELIHFLETRICPEYGVKAILRPHPSENGAIWKDALAGFQHIHIEGDRDFIPWVMACEALIHTGCTTGLEAFFLDRPAFSLQPGESGWDGNALSNAVNPVFPDATSLAQEIGKVLSGTFDNQSAFESGCQALAQSLTFDPDAFASPRITEEIIRLLDRVPADPNRPFLNNRTLTPVENSERQLEKIRTDEPTLKMRWSELMELTGQAKAPPLEFLGPAIIHFSAAAAKGGPDDE